MGLKNEMKRREAAEQFDVQLASSEFRERYWDELAELARNSSLVELLESTLHLEGDVIECGVYRGKSLFTIAHTLKENNSPKVLYACDSFQGFPPEQVSRFDQSLFRPISKLRTKFTMADDVPQRIERFCEYYGASIEIVKGYFCDTLPTLPRQKYCFIHLDVDIYESYRECLGQLYDHLVPGGVVVFDEYDGSMIPGKSKWPGGKRAIDEFFGNRPESISHCDTRSKPAWYVRKP